MFELISLLAQQSPKQVATRSTQPAETAPVSQTQTQTPSITPTVSVAIPEAVSVESATSAPVSTLAPDSEPVSFPTTAIESTSTNTATPSSTLPPQTASSAIAATSKLELPQVKVLPTPDPTSFSKPLNKPSVKVPSTKTAQTNPLKNKLESNLTLQKKPSTLSRAPLSRAPQSTSQVVSQTKSTEATPNLSQVPALFKPKTQPAASTVSTSTVSTKPTLPEIKTAKTVAPDRELVFDAPTLPSEAVSESIRNGLVAPASQATAPRKVETPKPTAQASPKAPAISSRDIVVPQSNIVPQANPSSDSAKPSTLSRDTAAPQPETSAIARQQKLLEQRLAEIVAKERAEKQAKQQPQQQDDLVKQAYDLATQRRFDRARQIAQNPSISSDVREKILSQINDLEIASRSLGITNQVDPAPTNRPNPIVNQPTNKPTIPTLPRTVQSLPKPIAQPPRSLQNLPNTPLRSEQTVTGNTQSDTPVEIVIEQRPQGLNPELANLGNSKDQIVYPLPEPVPVTSRFGWRVHPVTRVRRFHAGVDLGAAHGTPVLASRGGKVVAADRLGGYGLAVVMQHSDGTQDTLYAHLSQIFVRPGERIQPGTVIGRVGSTGLSTGPHLHYEARRKANTGWVAVDPGTQIEAARIRLVQSRQNGQSQPQS